LLGPYTMVAYGYLLAARLLVASLAPGDAPGASPAPVASDTAAPASPSASASVVTDASVSSWSSGDAPPGLAVQAPPRAFRRSGMGMLLELGAGSAVAVSSGLLLDHPPGWLRVSGPGGILEAITLLSVMVVGTGTAVGLTAYATDGPSRSPVHDVVGLGLGSLLGFGLGAGAVDSAVGSTSPTPSSALVFLGVPLGAVVGYNLSADDDARLPDASTRVSRKMSLCLVFGGNTLGGTGLDLGFQLGDRIAVALQGLDGDLGGAEGSARLRGYLLAARRSALYLSTGLHMTTGISRATEMALRTSTAVALGPVGSLGAEFRGESGIILAAELSGAYEPDASKISSTRQGPLYLGGAVMIGYAR